MSHEQLKRAVQALALPSGQQRALFPSFVCVADELALDFESALRDAGEVGGATEAQRAALEALDRYVDSISGPEHADIWSDDSLDDHPAWIQVRALAKGVLAAFGWPASVPAPNGSIYVASGRIAVNGRAEARSEDVAVVIEPLHDMPPGLAGALIAESEELGFRFVRRLVEEWGAGVNRFERPGEALFGAWVGGRLVGLCGLNVDPYAGDERTGRLRHLYVLAASRRLGIGRLLVMRVLQAARGRFDVVRLRTDNPAAARLYEAIGLLRCEGAGDHTHAVEVAAVLRSLDAETTAGPRDPRPGPSRGS